MIESVALKIRTTIFIISRLAAKNVLVFDVTTDSFANLTRIKQIRSSRTDFRQIRRS